MSAFICNDDHIGQLALFHVANRMNWSDDKHSAQEIADMLLDANIRSVNYRYDDEDQPTGVPCKLPHTLKVTDTVHIINMCGCLDYQSCELPDWKETDAYELLQGIRETAIRNLNGMDNAPWEYNEPVEEKDPHPNFF